MAMLPTRTKVLRLYREILRTGQQWQGPEEEAQYIKEEAQKLFRANRDVRNPELVNEKIFEAETRLELAVHYGIPYPRLYYTAPGRPSDAHENVFSHEKPAYMHSYFVEDDSDVPDGGRPPPR